MVCLQSLNLYSNMQVEKYICVCRSIFSWMELKNPKLHLLNYKSTFKLLYIIFFLLKMNYHILFYIIFQIQVDFGLLICIFIFLHLVFFHFMRALHSKTTPLFNTFDWVAMKFSSTNVNIYSIFTFWKLEFWFISICCIRFLTIVVDMFM